jgi:two-component system OmpR family sensor kinase
MRHRLPIKVRLVAGFAAIMLIVLTGAGAFVYLRVRYALDLRLNEDLATQTSQLVTDIDTGIPDPGDDVAGAQYQILDITNTPLRHTPGRTTSFLTSNELQRALRGPIRIDRGPLLPIPTEPLRLSTVPIHPGAAPPAGQPAVVLVAIRRDQRDEALRELIGQLTLANLAALAIASAVGYWMARRALDPVERYRVRAAQIAAGETGLRLAVRDEPHDEIARLGHTLNDMLAALDDALAAERRFINDASHELRTPLTLLAMELELALRHPRSHAELEETIRDAATDTAALIALADTLLTIGVPGVPHQRIDLAEATRDITDRYGNPAIDVRAGAPVLAWTDTRAYTRVVTNLIDNALRYGAPPITITVATTADNAVVAVHDDGPGIDPEFLHRATARFSRADTSRSTPGTGLGLALVDAIAHSHGGQIRLCSGPVHHHGHRHTDIDCTHHGQGTTISVVLPASAASPVRSGAPQETS